MTDLHDLLERESERFTFPAGPLSACSSEAGVKPGTGA